jgi:DNA primase
VAPDAQLAAWERFEPAERCAAALDYLYHRGYDEPERVAARYDLRFARLGKWSGRLLLPLSDGEELRSWTGRAWGLDEPKYLEQKSGLPGLVYSPRPARNTLLLVEGPMDALKLAVAGEDLPVAATALTGKAISPERLWRIVQLAKASQQILLALDSDAALAEAMRLLAELKAALPGKVVRRVKMPEHHKDPGEIPLYLAQQWLFGLAG